MVVLGKYCSSYSMQGLFSPAPPSSPPRDEILEVQLEHCTVLYSGTHTTLHYTVLRYTYNTALYFTKVHLHDCTVLLWGTPTKLHCTGLYSGTHTTLPCTILMYTCNTALYCSEVHLQHCTALYCTQVLMVSATQIFKIWLYKKNFFFGGGQSPCTCKNQIRWRKKNIILFSSGCYLIGSIRGMIPVIPPITGDLVVIAAKAVSSSILDNICYFCFTNMLDSHYAIPITNTGNLTENDEFYCCEISLS